MFWINKNTEIKLWTLAKIYPWNNSLNHCKQFIRNISNYLKFLINKGTIANNIEKNKRGKNKKIRKALFYVKMRHSTISRNFLVGELVSYLCKYKINKEVSLETKQLSNTGFAKFKTWPRFRGQKTKTLTKTLDAFSHTIGRF